MSSGTRRDLTAVLILIASAPAKAELPRTSAARPHVLDVELNPTGALSGSVIDLRGRPVASDHVVVRRGRRMIRRTKTDRQGRFRVNNLRSGLYEIVTSRSRRQIRVWREGLAPRSARQTILLSGDTQSPRSRVLIRGQSPVVPSPITVPPPPINEALFFAGAATGVGFFVADVIDDADEPAPTGRGTSGIQPTSGVSNMFDMGGDSSELPDNTLN